MYNSWLCFCFWIMFRRSMRGALPLCVQTAVQHSEITCLVFGASSCCEASACCAHLQMQKLKYLFYLTRLGLIFKQAQKFLESRGLICGPGNESGGLLRWQSAGHVTLLVKHERTFWFITINAANSWEQNLIVFFIFYFTSISFIASSVPFERTVCSYSDFLHVIRLMPNV